MTRNDNEPLEDFDPAQMLQEQAKHEAMARKLVERELTKPLRDPDVVVAHKMTMGKTESYIGSVTLDWLAQKVNFAHNLPVFNQKLSEDGKRVIVDASNVEEIKQRPIDFSREFAIAQYILFRDNRKFAPLLLVLHENWVTDPAHENWTNGQAVRSVANFESLDEYGTFGKLHLSPEHTLYAIDGQHRLTGIQAAIKFINGQPLLERKKTGEETGTALSKTDLQIARPELTDTKLQQIARERVGIEIITSVKQGERYNEAKERVRSVFVHVNSLGQVVDKGSLAALSEDGGYPLVAQKILDHGVLNTVGDDGELVGMVEFSKPNLTSANTNLTTLVTLASMTRLYLEWDEETYGHWTEPVKGLIPKRPSDEELKCAEDDFRLFLDLLEKLEVYQKVVISGDPKSPREFKKAGNGTKHFLLRPVAQQALAKAIGYLHFLHGWELALITNRLKQLDSSGAFSACNDKDSIWWGLQIKPDKGTVINTMRKETWQMLAYLLGGLTPEECEDLREKCILRRTLDDTTYGWNGEPVNPEDLQLPQRNLTS